MRHEGHLTLNGVVMNEKFEDKRAKTPSSAALRYNNPEVDYTQYITIDPSIRSGKPCVRGMRIAVSDVLDMLALGLTTEQVIEEYPYLTADDVLACLAFAADRERKINARVA